MFTQSVIEGIKALSDWRIPVGMAGVCIVSVGFITATSVVMRSVSESDPGRDLAVGCINSVMNPKLALDQGDLA